jgi:hypothetical protein
MQRVLEVPLPRCVCSSESVLCEEIGTKEMWNVRWTWRTAVGAIWVPPRRHFLLTVNCEEPFKGEKEWDYFISSAFRVPKEHCFVQGSQPLPVFPPGKSNMWMKMNMERWWNDTDRGKQKYWEKKKPVTVPLCPAQIRRGLTWDRIGASARRGRRLTARAMGRPLEIGKLNYTRISSPYRAVNTLRFGHTNQPVYAVQWNNRCLFSDSHITWIIYKDPVRTAQ